MLALPRLPAMPDQQRARIDVGGSGVGVRAFKDQRADTQLCNAICERCSEVADNRAISKRSSSRVGGVKAENGTRLEPCRRGARSQVRPVPESVECCGIKVSRCRVAHAKSKDGTAGHRDIRRRPTGRR